MEVTSTRSVALLLVLVASTRKIRFELSNSARVILTVSVAGGGGGGGGAVTGLIVSVLLRVTPLKVPLMIEVIVALTVVVLTAKLADDAPAATVTLAGTVAAGLLLARVTMVAAGAAALNLTVPCAALPPTTVVDDNVSADNESGVGVGAAGVTVTVTFRRPSWLLRIRMVTLCVDVTFLVVAVNRTLELPAGITTLEGTCNAVVLLLDTENEKPPEGAADPATRLIAICEELPPATLEGVAVTSP